MLKTLLYLLVFHEVRGSIGYWPYTLWPAGRFSLPKSKSNHGMLNIDIVYEFLSIFVTVNKLCTSTIYFEILYAR